MTCDICNDDQFPAEIVNDKLVCTRCKASASFAAPTGSVATFKFQVVNVTGNYVASRHRTEKSARRAWAIWDRKIKDCRYKVEPIHQKPLNAGDERRQNNP